MGQAQGASPRRLTDKRRTADVAVGCSASKPAVFHGKAHSAWHKLQTRAPYEPYPKAKASQAGATNAPPKAEQPRVRREISMLPTEACQARRSLRPSA